MTTTPTPTVIFDRDKDHGIFAETDGIIIRLTECCKASGKGSYVGDWPAVVCRACYQEVDYVYGLCADRGAPTFWSDLEALLKPCSADPAYYYCAGYVEAALADLVAASRDGAL